jgi:hypothetical protein
MTVADRALVIWKILWFIPAMIVRLLFVVMVMIFNLSFEDGRQVWDDTE